MIESLRDEVVKIDALNRALMEGAAQLRDRELAYAAAQVTEARTVAQEKQQAMIAQVTRDFDDQISRAVAESAQLIAELAPRSAGAELSELPEGDGRRRYTEFMRVGTLRAGESVRPAIVPFLTRQNLLLKGHTRESQELILAVLARAVSMVPLGHLRFLVFDPRVTGALGALAPLRAVRPASFPQAHSSPDSFTKALEEAFRDAAQNAERMAIADEATLFDLWNREGMAEGTLTVAVLLDYPYGVDDNLRNAVERSLAIGPATGVSVIIQEDPATVPTSFGVGSRLLTLGNDMGRWAASHYLSEFKIAHDGATPIDAIDRVLKDASQRASSVQGKTYPLDELISESIQNPWGKSSKDALVACIGKAGRQQLIVELRSENPPTPNLLIGGAVGQGKSNLILDIIYSLAADYSPHEMQMLLLDFKRGLEFKRFDADADGENWLPHVRALSLESDVEFGLAALRHVEEELAYRSEVFKEKGANSITEYREAGLLMPRLLLIIDEFQILFDGDDDTTEEAVRLLDLIAKQGRAYGIHLVLASQTTSGIAGLRLKGDSIFAQFPLRISLKNTELESQAILAQHNTAAADLTHRGEIIFNANYGQDPAGSNLRAMAAWVDPERFGAVQRDLWRRGHDRAPLVFIGTEYASWANAVLPKPAKNFVTETWVGRPVAITDQPYRLYLDSDSSQAVALVGTGNDEANATLVAMTLTALRSLGQEAPLIVLCGNEELSEELDAMVWRLREQGRNVTVVPRRQVPEFLVDEVVKLLERGEENPMLVVGVGLQRVPGMEKAHQSPDVDPLDMFSLDDEPNTGNGVLARLAKDGALQRIHFIGWWSSLNGVTDTLGFQRTGIGTYILLKVGIDDVREIAGPLAKLPSARPRVSVWQRGADEGLVSLVPFGPPPEEVWSS